MSALADPPSLFDGVPRLFDGGPRRFDGAAALVDAPVEPTEVTEALVEPADAAERAAAPAPPPAAELTQAFGTATVLARRLGGEPTLDDLLVGVWEGLAAHKPVACPACGDSMAPDYGAHALPVGGTCGGCGSRLT